MLCENDIQALPSSTGVYIFKERGKELYIGKANNIRGRVQDHVSHPAGERHRIFLARCDELDFIVTDDERSALFLENTLIKRFQPPFNIMLRDDKTFLYIRLTLSEPYPRIEFTRRISSQKDAYFGPFTSAGTVRKMIKFVSKYFGIRTCTLDLATPLDRPCLYYHMGSCLGPCVVGLTDLKVYGEKVQEAKLFLEGRDRELLKSIRRKINLLAKKEAFEEAAGYRDLYTVLKDMKSRKRVADAVGESVDVIAHHADRSNVSLAVLAFRKGLLVEKREFFWEGEPWQEDFYDEVLPRFYLANPWMPGKIVLDTKPRSIETLMDTLRVIRGRGVKFQVPMRGHWKSRVDMARENARVSFQRRFKGFVSGNAGLEELESILNLPPIRRIEAFDISHFRGKERYGAVIVFDSGDFIKRDYRTFRINLSHPEDDVAGMREIVSRRYRRVLDEEKPLPDLILIDGGTTQVEAARSALSSLETEIPIIGLAKREEVIIFPDAGKPLHLPKSNRALQLLQRIRDEVHRHVIHRHRKRREKRVRGGGLDTIPGVGEVRARKILQRLGSVKKAREASVETLQGILGPRVGLKVYEVLTKGEM